MAYVSVDRKGGQSSSVDRRLAGACGRGRLAPSPRSRSGVEPHPGFVRTGGNDGRRCSWLALPRARRSDRMRRWASVLTRAEWLRLGGFGGGVLLLHLLGWGLFLSYSRRNPALAGLGSLAYTFGLRHAFDADHIAAIDNTTRKFLQDGKRSMGVGFFFSLGHSTIVFSLAAGLAIATSTVNSRIPGLQGVGGYVGASVSGTFLLLIGLLNLLVLLDVLGVFRQLKQGRYDEQKLEDALQNQG